MYDTTSENRKIEDERRAQANRGGSMFSGEPCRMCGNFTLQRAGTCFTCVTCGETTGCS